MPTRLPGAPPTRIAPAGYVGAGLGQIGEFSLILANSSVALGLMPAVAQALVLATAIASIALNPLLFAAIDPVGRRLLARSPRAQLLHRSIDPLSELPATVDAALLTQHVVIIGYGRVGRRISDALLTNYIPQVVIERSRDFVEALRERNIAAVSGDASEPEVLIQGHVARARILVIATPDTLHVRKIVEVSRMLNPRIHIVVRTHSDEEAELLRNENVGEVFMGEHELALGMTRHVLERMAA